MASVATINSLVSESSSMYNLRSNPSTHRDGHNTSSYPCYNTSSSPILLRLGLVHRYQLRPQTVHSVLGNCPFDAIVADHVYSSASSVVHHSMILYLSLTLYLTIIPDDGHLIVHPYGQPMKAVAELLYFAIELLVSDPLERSYTLGVISVYVI